jgi:Protein of unknown function (DUF2851)
MINERFIQFIWQHKLFDSTQLKTVHGERILIQNQGVLNVYDGPDFLNARIQIGNLDWAGTVEIHVQDQDWLKHGHQTDANYNNVILHVVWSLAKQEAVPKDIPCLVLLPYVNESILVHYHTLLASKTGLPCQDSLISISALDKGYALDQMAFLRLNRKQQNFSSQLLGFGTDWRQMLFYLFAIALGKKANKEAMELLALALPFKVLAKHADESIGLNALLFGTAGLLIDESDAYATLLRKEYDFLRQKYNLTPISSQLWNYSQVRGSSKPHLSISILAEIVGLMSQSTDINYVDHVGLEKLSHSVYWQKHHSFGKKSSINNTVSKELIEHLKINVVVPYLALLANYYDDASHLYQAQSILEQIRDEKNALCDSLKKLGFEITNAFSSQGAIELKNEYCGHKRCLECHIGKKIVSAK